LFSYIIFVCRSVHQASPVLIHARSRAGGADVMVRAADAQVAVAIAQLLHRVWTA
jgi:hypothetical protein